MSLHSLYNGDIEIEFKDDAFHTYLLNGKRLTSVTSITGQLDKSAPLMYWAVGLARDFLDAFLQDGNAYDRPTLLPVIEEACKQHTVKKKEAASVGDIVHDFALAYATAKTTGGELPKIEDWPQEALNGINGFLDWKDSHNVTFRETERVIYSKKYNYVGRTDAVAILGNDIEWTVLDYKTANGIYPEMLLQLCLYWYALEEEYGEGMGNGLIVRFDKETGAFHEHFISKEMYNLLLPAALSLVTVKDILSNKEVKDFLKGSAKQQLTIV